MYEFPRADQAGHLQVIQVGVGRTTCEYLNQGDSCVTQLIKLSPIR